MRETRRPINGSDWPAGIPTPDAIRLARLGDEDALKLVRDLCDGHPGIKRALYGDRPALVQVEGPLCLRVVRGARGETAAAIRVRITPPDAAQTSYSVLLTPGPDGQIVAQVRTRHAADAHTLNATRPGVENGAGKTRV